MDGKSKTLPRKQLDPAAPCFPILPFLLFKYIYIFISLFIRCEWKESEQQHLICIRRELTALAAPRDMNRWECLAILPKYPSHQNTHTHTYQKVHTPPSLLPHLSSILSSPHAPQPLPAKCSVNLSLLIAQNSRCHMPRSDF